jgi:hypothetical protein
MTWVKRFETTDSCCDDFTVHKCAICVDLLALQGTINAAHLCAYSNTFKTGDGCITTFNLNVTP